MSSAQPDRPLPSTRVLWFTVLAVAVLYVWGIDNLYMPSNGDEMVYAHIARLTAASGQWLPLVSDLNDMRNTKPPLLFWQSMVVSGWGHHWHLWLLRLPSLVYLVGVCLGMSMLLHRWSGEWRTAAWAVLCLLLSWGTFRYGRPYLTTAPEMFWFSLAPAWVLWRAAHSSTRGIHASASEWLAWTVLGLLTGLGLAYKSFALIAPLAAATWAMRLVLQPQWSWRDAVTCTAQTAWWAVLSVGVFALWLWLDPQPQEVWREFVQHENAGKLGAGQSYLSVLFSVKGSGDYLAAPLLNTGLLFPWVAALMLVGWRHARAHGLAWRGGFPMALWTWIAVWCLVFLIPSQRSSRYLLPLMPAVAMLLALHAETFPAWVTRSTAWLSAIALAVLSWLAWHAHSIGVLPTAWALGVAGAGVVVVVVCVALWRSAVNPIHGLWSAALFFFGFNALMQGMSMARVGFEGNRSERPVADTVWVVEGFNGEFERLQFLLPGRNRFVPQQSKINALSEGTDRTSGTWFIVPRVLNAPPLACETLQTCERMAVRWDIEQRLKPGQVHAGNWTRPSEWLWRQEWLMRVR